MDIEEKLKSIYNVYKGVYNEDFSKITYYCSGNYLNKTELQEIFKTKIGFRHISASYPYTKITFNLIKE